VEGTIDGGKKDGDDEHAAFLALAVLTAYLRKRTEWNDTRAIEISEKVDELQMMLDRVEKLGQPSEEHRERVERLRQKVENEYTFDFDNPSQEAVSLVTKTRVKLHLREKDKEIGSQEKFFAKLNELLKQRLKNAKQVAEEEGRATIQVQDIKHT
jgi:cysteinyl-tRNA synthetase